MLATFQLLALFAAELLALFAAPTADRLQAAFAARQAKYRTLDVTVRSTDSTAGRRLQEDQTAERVHRLVVDGDKLRFEGEMRRGGANGDVYHKPFLMVSVGGPTHTLFPSGVYRAAGKPMGAVEPPGQILRFTGGCLQPIIDHYRGTDTPLSRLTPTGRREKIGPHNCVEYILPREYSYWFDPVADFTLVRMSGMSQGRPQRLLDIESTAEGPVRWIDTFFDNSGKVQRKFTATVVAAKRNEPVPAEMFVLPFPPGTFVQDTSDYPAGRTTSYIIAEDGTKVPVKDEPAEDDPAAEPHEPFDWMPPAIAGGVLLALAAWLLRRRIRG